jgi:hypothetical protein
VIEHELEEPRQVLLVHLHISKLHPCHRYRADSFFPIPYRLLETIRQYGEERLDPDEAEALRASHGEHYAQLAEQYFAHEWDPDQLDWYRRVADDGENLVAAMHSAVDTDNADVGLRIGASLHSAHQVGYAVTIPAEPALALRGAAGHPLYPMALVKAAVEATERGDRRLVEELCAQALDAERPLGDPSGGLLDVRVSLAQGLLEMNRGFYETAADHFQRGGELALAAGNLAFAAEMFTNAASVGVGGADEAGAVDAANRALTLARQSAAPLTTNMALTAVASALARVDPARARTLLTEAIDAMGGLGSEYAGQLTLAVIVAARLGDWPLTLPLSRRAIPLLHWIATLPYPLAMLHLTALALAEARPATAARLQGAARKIGRTLAANQGPGRADRAVMAPPTARVHHRIAPGGHLAPRQDLDRRQTHPTARRG